MAGQRRPVNKRRKRKGRKQCAKRISKKQKDLKKLQRLISTASSSRTTRKKGQQRGEGIFSVLLPILGSVVSAAIAK